MCIRDSNSITNVNVLDATAVDKVGGTLTIGATSSNVVISNLGTFSATNVNTAAVDNPSSSLLIGSNSSSVRIQNADYIFTQHLDAGLGNNLYIGYDAATSNTIMDKVYSLNCVPASSGGGLFSNVRLMNQAPACGPAVLQFLNNIGGFHIGSLTVPPQSVGGVRNNVVFGNSWVGNEFINNQGITVPAYSVFTYSNFGSGVSTQFSNNTTTPFFYADTGFAPSASTQIYSLVPILV